MAEAKFTYKDKDIVLTCDKNQKMKDICANLGNKINVSINFLRFYYGESLLDLEKTFQEITKENRISIIIEEICPKCGRILNDEIFDDIISSNTNANSSLEGIKHQIELIVTDIINKVNINDIISQLKNINLILNNINEDFKKMNDKLNMIRLNNNNNIKLNKNYNKKEEILKNEIICIYDKQEDEINLLHDYTDKWKIGEEYYIEAKNNINDNNIDIYINDKKIKFNYKYKSNEKGNIQVKFVFNKLLTSTNSMFCGCSSLQSINLSSFNTTDVKDMSYMFSFCSSLQSINLSSFNTNNVKKMSYMFRRCSSLQTINLSSFNTINVTDMSCMFAECYSLQSLDLSSFNTTKVEDMNTMFWGCSSLQSLDLSSFDTTNVKDMSFMFSEYSPLKKENVKINNNGKRILNELD